MYIGFHANFPLFFSNIDETWLFCRQIFEKYLNIKFREKSVQREPSFPMQVEGQTRRSLESLFGIFQTHFGKLRRGSSTDASALRYLILFKLVPLHRNYIYIVTAHT